MSHASSSRVVEELRDRIAHLEGSVSRKALVLPFGVPEVDERLPGGGLAYGALHEVAGGGAGTVDGAAAAPVERNPLGGHSMSTSAGEPYHVLVTCEYFEPGFRAGGPIRSIAAISIAS